MGVICVHRTYFAYTGDVICMHGRHSKRTWSGFFVHTGAFPVFTWGDSCVHSEGSLRTYGAFSACTQRVIFAPGCSFRRTLRYSSLKLREQRSYTSFPTCLKAESPRTPTAVARMANLLLFVVVSTPTRNEQRNSRAGEDGWIS